LPQYTMCLAVRVAIGIRLISALRGARDGAVF